MTFDLSRLRRGEWLAGAGGVLLLVSLFLLQWYTAQRGLWFSFSPMSRGMVTPSGPPTADGWHSHTILRWFMLVTIVAALFLFIATLTQETPAVPAASAPVVTAIALLTTVLLAYRVVINEPGPNGFIDVKIGAWIGLLACALVTCGAYLTMRTEGGPLTDVPVQPRTLSQ
jgi:hypothetical protein